MSDEGNDIRPGFVRQRRNLVITSLVLLFSLIHEIKPIHEINFPGGRIEFANPVTIQQYLVIVFLYFTLRYYVYFRDIGDKGFYNAVKNRLQHLAARYTPRLYRDDPSVRESLEKQILESLKNRQHNSPTLPAHDPLEIKEAGVIGRVQWRHLTIQARFNVVARTEGKIIYQNDEYPKLEVIGVDAIQLNIHASLYVLMHTRILTEYFLPFGIAALPVMYFVYFHLANYLNW